MSESRLPKPSPMRGDPRRGASAVGRQQGPRVGVPDVMPKVHPNTDPKARELFIKFWDPDSDGNYCTPYPIL
jgi:hypothetical protein